LTAAGRSQPLSSHEGKAALGKPFPSGLNVTRSGENIAARYRIEVGTAIVSGRDRAAIEKFLSPVNGVGPKVLKNFFLLRGI
jgi:hypothetical protein